MSLRIWKHRVSRLLALSSVEARDLALAQWFLVSARLRRRWTTAGRFMEIISDKDIATGPVTLDDHSRALGQRLALALERAAENGPVRATCLERAVALDRLLRRHGVMGGRIRVGVRWQDGQFLAHAWVELGDIVLADSPRRVQAFQTIADARMAAS